MKVFLVLLLVSLSSACVTTRPQDREFLRKIGLDETVNRDLVAKEKAEKEQREQEQRQMKDELDKELKEVSQSYVDQEFQVGQKWYATHSADQLENAMPVLVGRISPKGAEFSYRELSLLRTDPVRKFIVDYLVEFSQGEKSATYNFEVVIQKPPGERASVLQGKFVSPYGRKAYSEVVTKTDPMPPSFRRNSKIRRAIAGRKVYMGMPEEALLISWGPPERTNVTNVRGLEHKQFVYDGLSSIVYTDNGVVTSWQQSR